MNCGGSRWYPQAGRIAPRSAIRKPDSRNPASARPPPEGRIAVEVPKATESDCNPRDMIRNIPDAFCEKRKGRLPDSVVFWELSCAFNNLQLVPWLHYSRVGHRAFSALVSCLVWASAAP